MNRDNQKTLYLTKSKAHIQNINNHNTHNNKNTCMIIAHKNKNGIKCHNIIIDIFKRKEIERKEQREAYR